MHILFPPTLNKPHTSPAHTRNPLVPLQKMKREPLPYNCTHVLVNHWHHAVRKQLREGVPRVQVLAAHSQIIQGQQHLSTCLRGMQWAVMLPSHREGLPVNAPYKGLRVSLGNVARPRVHEPALAE